MNPAPGQLLPARSDVLSLITAADECWPFEDVNEEDESEAPGLQRTGD